MYAITCEQGDVYWEKFREKSGFISSTQVAAIIHCSKNKSKRRLWEEMFEGRKRSTFVSDAMEMGQREEGRTLQECIDYLGVPDPVYRPGIICDLSGDKFCCSPDAVVITQSPEEEEVFMYGIEIKNRVHSAPPSKPEEIPPDHLLQCFSSLHITQAAFWILFTKCQETEEVSCFMIDRDDIAWEKIKSLAQEFRLLKTPPSRKTVRDRIVAEDILQRIREGVFTLVQIP